MLMYRQAPMRIALLGGPRVDDRLVQTDGRADPFGQLGVVEDVGVVQRLLDERQPQVVDRPEERQVVERVAGIEVDVEGHVREGRR